jgi:hypothetical protein
MLEPGLPICHHKICLAYHVLVVLAPWGASRELHTVSCFPFCFYMFFSCPLPLLWFPIFFLSFGLWNVISPTLLWLPDSSHSQSRTEETSDLPSCLTLTSTSHCISWTAFLDFHRFLQLKFNAQSWSLKRLSKAGSSGNHRMVQNEEQLLIKLASIPVFSELQVLVSMLPH